MQNKNPGNPKGSNHRLINTNMDNDIILKITKFCRMHNEILTKKQKHFQANYIQKTRSFYVLPKIHKSEEMKITVKAQNLNTYKFQTPVTSNFDL